MKRTNSTILITAGPTIEPIDPIRYLSNYSTGMMGYEVAKEAKKRGLRVILVSGPTFLQPPRGITFVPVRTAEEMRRAVLRYFQRADCVVMAAAVCDFRPAAFQRSKIKKQRGKTLSLRLKRNPDILAELGKRKGRKVLVGYSLETEHALRNAREKLKNKNLDIIVLNRCGKKGSPFGGGTTKVTILDSEGGKMPLRPAQKNNVARIVLDKISNI